MSPAILAYLDAYAVILLKITDWIAYEIIWISLTCIR